MWIRVARSLLSLLLASSPLVAGAAWQPAGVDLTRPRLLMRPGDVPVVQQRLAREPYRTQLARIVNQTVSAAGWDLADHDIPAEREKSKAAKNWAFLYAIDRTQTGGVVVPFASAAARQAAGDHARDFLLAMYTTSRIADTFDDDINTSEEILNSATAYDTLLGAGYPLTPEDDAAIEANLVALAADLYEDYLGLDPRVGTSAVFSTTLPLKAAVRMVLNSIVTTAPLGRLAMVHFKTCRPGRLVVSTTGSWARLLTRLEFLT